MTPARLYERLVKGDCIALNSINRGNKPLQRGADKAAAQRHKRTCAPPPNTHPHSHALQELIFTGRRVGADEAAALRLVDHAVDEGRAMERALEIAADIAQVIGVLEY